MADINVKLGEPSAIQESLHPNEGKVQDLGEQRLEISNGTRNVIAGIMTAVALTTTPVFAKSPTHCTPTVVNNCAQENRDNANAERLQKADREYADYLSTVKMYSEDTKKALAENKLNDALTAFGIAFQAWQDSLRVLGTLRTKEEVSAISRLGGEPQDYAKLWQDMVSDAAAAELKFFIDEGFGDEALFTKMNPPESATFKALP